MISSMNCTTIIRKNGNGSVFNLCDYKPTFVLSDITLLNCVSMNGNGGGISVELESECHVSLNSLSFTSCHSLTGYGGGIYISAAAFLSDDTLTFHSLIFSDCSDCQNGISSSNSNTGNGIFITVNDILNFTHYNNWNLLFNLDSYDASRAAVYTGRTAMIDTFSLLHLLFSPGAANESVSYVAMLGKDTDVCGWIESPCTTINQTRCNCPTVTSIQLFGGTLTYESNRIWIHSSSSLAIDHIDSDIDSTPAVLAVINSDLASWNIFYIEGSLNLSQFSISLPIAIDSYLFVISSKGALTLNSMVINGAGYSSFNTPLFNFLTESTLQMSLVRMGVEELFHGMGCQMEVPSFHPVPTALHPLLL